LAQEIDVLDAYYDDRHSVSRLSILIPF